jgi:hypothetical protein
MRRHLYTALTVSAALVFLPASVKAQEANGPTLPGMTGRSVDQYPSILSYNADSTDGTEATLYCGYAWVDETGPRLDTDLRELSYLNESKETYLRVQRIDQSLIVTTVADKKDSNGRKRFLLEAVNPDSSVTAKECQINLQNDTISDCVKSQPFMGGQQMKDKDAFIAQQCANLFAELRPQLSPKTPDAKKTEAFKNALRRKLETLKQ